MGGEAGVYKYARFACTIVHVQQGFGADCSDGAVVNRITRCKSSIKFESRIEPRLALKLLLHKAVGNCSFNNILLEKANYPKG